MVHGDKVIVDLISIFARGRKVTISTASRLLTGSGDTVSRICAVMSITPRRAEKIIQMASTHWPADTPWPSDIPRPVSNPKEAA